MKVVAVCACTVGIAHTYMAQKAIENEFKKRGIDIKVETQGGTGIDNALSQEEIDAADFVLFSVDVGVEGDERFEEKRSQNRFLKCGTAEAIKDMAPIADAVIDMEKVASSTSVRQAGLFDNLGRTLLDSFNTGVSYFIPVVVVGGVFLAFSLATGTAGSEGMEVTNPFMQNLNLIGMAGINMMIPVLAAYIAYSISGKPALAPGFVLGYLVNNPVAVGDTKVSTGFLGAMIISVFAGYLVKWIKTWKVNDTVQTIMPVLIIPILSTLVLGMLYIYVLAYPLSVVMDWLTGVLGGLQGGSALILGLVIGLMTAFDMGGPINKAAYVTGTGLLASGEYHVMAAVMAGGMVPPLAIALATTFFKNRFTESQRKAGITNYVMGLSFITEGAIPFAASDPVRVIPSMVVGSALAGALTMFFDCTLRAPHGGIFVVPTIGNPLMYLVSILIGAVVGAVILSLLKKPIKE